MGGATEGEPDASMEGMVRSVTHEWIAAVHALDIDHYMNLHWADAVKIDGKPHGVLHIRKGAEEIRENMSGIFEEYGDFLSGHEYPTREYLWDEVTGTAQIRFGAENPGVFEVLRFEERDGAVKISEHWVFNRFFPEPETGEMTAWADEEGNGNGRLEPGEQERLFAAVREVVHEPGRIDTPLDEFFDWNGSGELEEWESEIAGQVLLRNRFRAIDQFSEELARHRLPPADERELNIHDTNWIDSIMRRPAEDLLGYVEEAQMSLLDFNADGMVSPLELEIYRDIIMRAGAVNPAPVLYDKQMPAFIADIRNWTDADVNGEIGEEERLDAGWELFGLTQESWGAPVFSPIYRFFDRNRDGRVEEIEAEWSIDFIADFLFPAAVGQEIPVYDWIENRSVPFQFYTDGRPELSGAEIDELRSFLRNYREEFWEGEDPNATEFRWLDHDGDDRVAEEEVRLFREMLFDALMITWFRMPAAEANTLAVRSALDRAADGNGDGLLSMGEREELIDALSSPHEAVTAFDRGIDIDRNGSITGEELARARETGYIPADSASAGSAEQRSAALTTDRRVSERPAGSAAGRGSGGTPASANSAPVRAVSMRGSTLAVLGVRDMTEEMANASRELLISFLENAFVNYGNVTVVDRQNLEKIMEEYKYQSSGMVDEETAVEIGKLSGADAIAIGNLSRLSDTYYLHLKVISVQTGAIVGSSISEGASEKDFLGMCNGAVEPLF
jgi:hypothetical protein